MRSLHSYAVLVGCLCLAACESPLPFGPGRARITLERATVLQVESNVLFPEFKGLTENLSSPKQHWALRMQGHADRDLNEFFEGWQLQVRCTVEGAADGRSYRAVATGPRTAVSVVGTSSGTSQSTNIAGQKPSFNFVIDTFVDLTAQDEEYVNGRPRSTLNLRTATFEKLSCYILGVTKAPVLFPRTNSLNVSHIEFQALLRATGQ